uniref:Uncharacterized protein n=1 Tax=Avena sativa TaxID=4498 RepID=A0ACD5TT53_AVESA
MAAAQTLELTPTWILAGMCSFIVLPSLVAERCLHYLAKAVKRRHPKPLYRVFLKIKQELLQGFVALLLTVFQNLIQKTCISPSLADHMLPCQRANEVGPTKLHYVASQIIGRFGSRMLNEDAEGSAHCRLKGKVPLLSSEVIHQLEIFIFVLAVTHVTFSVSTMVLGVAKIREWKQWEVKIRREIEDNNGPGRTFPAQENLFIRNHLNGFGQDSRVLSWLHCFVKQFYGSVTKIDYTTMRHGFIMRHFRQYPRFDFHQYMMRILQNDFKKVVGISWYMWIFVMFYLLLNINGWHTYFWISFLPLLLLLAIGTKLQHIIDQLARDISEMPSLIGGAGDLAVKPSDDLFWFRQPRIILYLIHFILFQNAFEIAFFIWILITYGFNSCIMGKAGFTVPRLVIGVIIQFVCSYSTLPLYAIVTQMGSSFNNEFFSNNVQRALRGWVRGAKMRRRYSLFHDEAGSIATNTSGDPAGLSIEMTRRTSREGNFSDENIE